MDLQEIISRRETVLGERKDKAEAHAVYLKAADAELDRLREAEALIVGGLDFAKIERGRAIVQVQGLVGKICHGEYADQPRSDTRAKTLADAKADIAAGGPKIKQRYFGIKNYSGFGDQREDHAYYMGPKHGQIVFSIGLSPEARLTDLTAAQIDDALYLLSALPTIENLKAEAEAA